MERRDVVVIGGGLSGLVAAKELLAAKKSVVVLEANDRVGGRVHTEALDVAGAESLFDVGAGYVGKTQTRLTALATELGFDMRFGRPGDASSLVPSYAEGKMVLFLDGARHLEDPSAAVPTGGLGPFTLLGLARVVLLSVSPHVETMKRYLDAPWAAPEAKAWDETSVEAFLQSFILLDEATKNLVRIAVRAAWSAEADEVSLLYFLWYVASAGGLDVILGADGDGAQAYRFADTAQAVPDRLAAKLGADVVRTEQPVISVTQEGARVVVRTLAGLELEAGRVVVAMSPFMSSKLHYAPHLPELRMQLVQRMPLGRTTKNILTYETPFWRAKYNGMCISNSTPVVWTMDDVTPGGRAAMMAFVVADAATAHNQLDAAARERAVCQAVADTFDDARFLSPTGFLEKNWCAEPWSWGCPTGLMGPGALTGYGAALRAPFGRVHWAGTETSPVWSGYMEGAVRSGERVAREILESAP